MKVTFLHLGNPGNHQLLSRGQLGREGLGFFAGSAHFFGIAAVEGNPGPGHGQVWIGLHRGAPVVIAALQVEIFVILHALFVERACLDRRGRYRHRSRSSRLDVVGISVDGRDKAHAKNEDKDRDGAIGATHQGLRKQTLSEERTTIAA